MLTLHIKGTIFCLAPSLIMLEHKVRYVCTLVEISGIYFVLALILLAIDLSKVGAHTCNLTKHPASASAWA